MADTKTISGQFTGAYAIHPLSGEKFRFGLEITFWLLTEQVL